MERKFSHYTVHTDVVFNDKGKRYLSISIRNLEDNYDGILLHLTPAQAKILSKAIHWAALAIEQQSVKEK
jgi:hypothetical protein